MLRIDPALPTPPYEQLRSQLIKQISDGELVPGAKLPAVRRLASDLGLAPNTVARTYRELEAAGYVRTQGRNGTIVSTPDLGSPEIHERALGLATDYVTGMQALGLGQESMITYLQRSLNH